MNQKRDPVAALARLIDEALEHTNDAALIARAIERQGYVLVNAEGLAAALTKVNTPTTWWEPTTTPMIARAILAAIQEQAGGER